MQGMLCEVCGEAICRYERRSGILECDKCHADIKAGRRADPLRKAPVKLNTGKAKRNVA
jgi:hypothetical protein